MEHSLPVLLDIIYMCGWAFISSIMWGCYKFSTHKTVYLSKNMKSNWFLFSLCAIAISLISCQPKKTTDDYNKSAAEKIQKKDYKGAIEDLTKVIELTPKDAGAYFGRGLTKITAGDYKGAIEDYNKSIELDPKNSWAYSDRGNAKTRLNDLEGAVEDYTKAFDLNHGNIEAVLDRGYCKQTLGDIPGACADWTIAAGSGNTLAAEALAANCK